MVRDPPVSLAVVLLILAAVAAAEAVVALWTPERGSGLTMMAVILVIAVALVLLDLGSTAAVVATSPSIG